MLTIYFVPAGHTADFTEGYAYGRDMVLANPQGQAGPNLNGSSEAYQLGFFWGMTMTMMDGYSPDRVPVGLVGGGGRGATYDQPGISSGGRGPGGLAYGSEEAYSPLGDESGVSSGGHFGGFGGATISSTGEGSAPVGDEQGVATGNRVNINSLRRGGGGATSFYEDNSGGQQPGQGNSGN